MLVRMWRKENPFALLVWMYIGAAAVESSMEIPQKLKMDLPFDPAIPFLGIYLKEPKTLIWKNISTAMFIAVLFTISTIWKQPKCPSIDEWIKQLWDIYTMVYNSAIKKKKFSLCCHMGEPGEHYPKPVREIQIPYNFTHTWNLMNKLN